MIRLIRLETLSIVMVDSLGFSTASVNDGEIEQYSFDGEGTTVLAFFPGAFTPPCTEEMCRFRDQIGDFVELDTEVVGISVDTPFALEEFADKNSLNFRLASDTSREIIEQYGVKTVFPDTGHEIAERAVFLIKDGEIVYREVMDDPHNLPDLDRLKQEINKI